ncbi:hypothetical protein [Zhaonella formicivorans]|uniref:hypothetical protein n=1 Tax=Zhaonella formicivorans TaxID=2528593 RepID=UPI0010E2E5B4|nr:hypothetical protein [Zhaonella formicivorans]
MLLDLDLNALSKKLKVNTAKIIKAWKAGKRDWDITQSSGIEQWKLNWLRRELQHERWKITIKRKSLLRNKGTSANRELWLQQKS